MGGGVGGGRLNARTALCVSPPLAGWGVRACFGTRRKKTCRDLVAGRAQTMAQVGSRRKKTCRFSWQAAEISWQAQHGGWRKLAQVEKEKRLQISLHGSRVSRDFVAGTAQRMAQVGSRRKKLQSRFRGRHSKEAKDSKVLFYFWLLDWVHLFFQ